MPPRVECLLTEKGRKLAPALRAIEIWGGKYDPQTQDREA